MAGPDSVSSKPTTTTGTIRNERTSYIKNRKPNFNMEVKRATVGAVRKEVIPYAPGGKTKPDGTPDMTSKQTIYYDKDGKQVASVSNVRGSEYDIDILSTPDADYYDVDMDGKIDYKEVDREYQYPLEMPESDTIPYRSRLEIEMKILKEELKDNPFGELPQKQS